MGEYKINIKRSAEKELYIGRILFGDVNPILKTIAVLEVALGKDVIGFTLEANTTADGRVATMIIREKA